MATSARLVIEDPEAFDRPRHSALVRITHWITTLAFFGLLASGIAILLAHPRLYWGETGTLGTPSLLDLPLPLVLVGQSGWGRYLHFLSAWACVLTGLVYVLWGLFTSHFRDHLVPNRDHSGDQERYNTVQRLSYLAVVFLLFPLIILTGLAMSPALASVFPVLVIVFGGHQSARTIHFFVANLLVLFLLVHVTKVGFAGFSARVRAMVTGRTGAQRRVFTPSRLSRRKLVTSGVAVAAGASGLAVLARVADRYDLIPPDHGGLFGAGETLTYAAQRLLMSHHSLVREFDQSRISTVFPVNGGFPRSELYRLLFVRGFRDWRLTVDGLVARPSSLSLADLKRFPSRTQITHQACEEGWSFIAEWTGVPLSYILNLVGVRPGAKYVVFFPFDDSWDSLDLADSFHPQTLLAYGMNGGDLPAPHGAPVRLRVARQLGYKSVKYLSGIRVTDSLRNIGKGLGSISPELGYSWYAGI